MKRLPLLLLVLIVGTCSAQNNNKYIVKLPKDYNSEKIYPLFIALHGGNGNMTRLSKEWKSERLSTEFITVYMEASHLDRSPNGWGWRDVSAEGKNIKKYYDQVVANHHIDTSRLFVGGFSLGAKMSFDLAMNNQIPVKGIVAVCHGGLSSVAVNKANIQKSVIRGVKYVVVYGENDNNYRLESIELIQRLKNANAKLLTYKMEEVGHRLPSDFEEPMDKKWLPFIMN